MPNTKAIKETRFAVKLLIPTSSTYHGKTSWIYPETGDTIFVSWKSYGGTEAVKDGVLSILDTAQVSCRYRPDIKANCRLLLPGGEQYEIKGKPENVGMENRQLIFKVECVEGGA